MKLIIDFDDVIFDTKSFKKSLFEILARSGAVNAQDLYEKERNKETPFSLLDFLHRIFSEQDACNDQTSKGNIIYKEIMSGCKLFINEEMISFLKEIGKENCYVVTNGDMAFQMDKLARTGVDVLVKEICVVSGSKKEEVERLCVLFLQEKVIFVDDKVKFFDDIDMTLCNNLKTIIYDKTNLGTLKNETSKSGSYQMVNPTVKIEL